MERPGCLDRRRRTIAGDLAHQSADPEALERSERVERHPRQPDRAAQADRIGAGPEELAAIVEVANPGGGDDRQVNARIAKFRDNAQPDRLDRPTGDAAEAVLHERLAGLRIQPEALDRVDGGQGGDPIPLREPGLLHVVLVRGELEDDWMAR